jgi:hypothetical protein
MASQEAFFNRLRKWAALNLLSMAKADVREL